MTIRTLFLCAALAACASSPNVPGSWQELSPGQVAELRDELVDRMAEDQAIRSQMGPEMSEEQLADAVRIDSENTARLEELVDAYGWPPSSVVGEEASLAAFLLVQHADLHPEFQERCLPMLKDAASRNEISPGHLAYLVDRVRVAKGEPQVYGTQYGAAQDGDGVMTKTASGDFIYVLCPVEDPDQLDARREAVGLGPWHEYERSIAEMQERAPCATPKEAMERTGD